jgi:queuine/archaeosine tRNA-ribosyltransferase
MVMADREIKLPSGTIKTPVLWLGHIVEGKPVPWSFFEVDNVIMNACDIFSNKKAKEKIEKIGIFEYLKEEGAGRAPKFLMLDSGGFLFQAKQNVTVSAQEIFDFYVKARPTLAVNLDHPLSPAVTPEENSQRLELTMRNLEIMLNSMEKVKEKFPIIPTIHGYDSITLKLVIKKIAQLYDSYSDLIPMLALGSLVPLIRSTGEFIDRYTNIWRLSSRRKIAFEIILTAKELIKNELEDIPLHVFGIGGTSIMFLCYYAGADSIDSIGWRMSAAHGFVHVFQVGERYFSKREADTTWNPPLSEEEFKILQKCECPVCKDNPLKLRDKFTDRALHNAFVYLKEAKFLASLKEDELEAYVDKRLFNTQLYSLFRYVRDRKNQKRIEHFI